MVAQERKAKELVDKLGFEAWVGDVDVHYAEVCVIAPRELPAGLLEVVSRYGNMRVEGIRHETSEVELSVLVS